MKTTVINDHSITSGLSCARTRPLFAFGFLASFEPGTHWEWRLGYGVFFTLVYHHSVRLWGKPEQAKPSVDTLTKYNKQRTKL